MSRGTPDMAFDKVGGEISIDMSTKVDALLKCERKCEVQSVSHVKSDAVELMLDIMMSFGRYCRGSRISKFHIHIQESNTI